VDIAWQILSPVLEAWATGDARKFPNHEAGTWGPAEADTLVEKSGRRWRRP
jgi:glucose-6-phosphate 1-dehydrogenase